VVRAWLAAGLPALALSALGSARSEPSVLSAFNLAAKPDLHWELPRSLDEISGLTYTEDGRLLAHGDERAIVFELDPRSGTVVKRFGFGNPPVPGDFEDIVAVGDVLFLVTSDGVLYQGKEGADGEHVGYAVIPTGLGRRCEVEGLAYEPSDHTLLLACKTPRSRVLRGMVAVYRWSLERRKLLPTPAPVLPLSTLARGLPGRGFHPSAITRDPASGHYLLLAAREHALAEVTPDGQVLGLARLRPSDHRQAEGLTFAPDGSLLLSDEAAGKRATLTVYRAHER
jgi:uncharacterized protein YjiK